MSIQLRNITTYTVDKNTMHDIELSGGAFFDLLTWYNLSADLITPGGYAPSLQYPFNDEGVVFEGSAPFADLFVLPLVEDEVTNVCVTHEDSWADENTTQCKEISGISYNTYSAGTTAYETLISHISGITFADVQVLILKNDKTEILEYSVIWPTPNGGGNATPTWSVKSINTSDMDGINISFKVEDYKLFIGYEFTQASGLFTDKWEIFTNTLYYPIPATTSSKHPTNIINISGSVSGKQNILTKPLSSIGYLGTIGLSGTTGSTVYNITNAFNGASASSFAYNHTTTDYTTLPLLSTEIVGDTISLFISGSTSYDYQGFIFDSTAFSKTAGMYYSADNFLVDTGLTVSNNAYINNKKQYGSIWYNFISNGTDIEINKTAGAWNSGSNVLFDTFQLEGLITEHDPNMGIAAFENNKIGLSLRNGSGYWNLSGFRFDFDNKIIPSTYWKSFNTVMDNGQVDAFNLGASNAVIWDIDINPFKSNDILKRRVYALTDNNNNISYNVKNITNNLKSTAYDFFTPLVSANGENITLSVSGLGGYDLKGSRTLINNVSSFTRNVSDVAIVSGDGYFVNSSNSENNLWTIYASGSEGDFLATINSHKTTANIDIVCSNYMSSAVELNVQNSGPSEYSLFITNPTSQSWNVTGYKITDETATVYSVNANSSTTLFTTPATGSYSQSVLLLNSKQEDIYSSQVVDYVWSPYIFNSNINTEHIANINTTTTSLCEYKTLTNAFPLIEASNTVTLGVSSTLYNWNVSAVDISQQISNISTAINTIIIRESDGIFDYIYSHPDTYNISVSTNTQEVSTFNDFYSVVEIPPILEVSPLLNGNPTTIASVYSATPNEELVSYYTGPGYGNTPSNNEIYFTTIESKPGSFPIHDIKIDWGDDTGLAHVTRSGIAATSRNTIIDVISTAFPDNTNDVRRFGFLHTFPSSYTTFNISATAFSIDTRSHDVFTLALSGYEGVTSFGTKRLLKSNLRTDGNILYNIES